MNRFGGVVIAEEITALVMATGGSHSPYRVLYFVLLVYGTIFYGTRRLFLTSVVLVVLAGAPYLRDRDARVAAELTALLVQVGVWIAIALVVNALILQLRARRGSWTSSSSGTGRCSTRTQTAPTPSMRKVGSPA